MHEDTQSPLHDYQNGQLDRRAFLARLITLTGSMAAAHLLLEKTGLAQTVLSEKESERLGIVSSEVRFPGRDDVTLDGALSTPPGAARHPGIVVIHENRGLNEHIRSVARRFAEAGFVALAPDALARVGGTGSMASPDAAREAIGKLSPETTMDDLKAALAYLNAHPRVLRGRLASIGFCWGGARSFLLATESDLLRAAIVFYGSAPPPEKLTQVRCPVFGFYGETDERITSQVPEVARTMAQAGKQFEYKIYPGAGHAFFNDTGERYNAAAAADAWKLTLKYLNAHLR
jgi:carboxymethylenebutenolidase